MVTRGGKDIFPRGLEEFRYTHPDIADAQDTRRPHEKYGEELYVWVRKRPRPEPKTAQSLRQFATGKLTHYPTPGPSSRSTTSR